MREFFDGFWKYALRLLLTLLGIVSALCLIAFGYPLASEGASSSCMAFATRAYEISDTPKNTLAYGMIKLTGGFVLESRIASKYPGESASLLCTSYYWDSVIEPESYRGFTLGAA
jgi:hypothetical protein